MFLKCCLRNDNDAALYLAPLGYFIRGERKNSVEIIKGGLFGS